MNENESIEILSSELCDEGCNFDELEKKLESDLEEQLSDLESLEELKANIGDPDALGEAVLNAVWNQFIMQIGKVAGEEFVSKNGGLPFDLRDSKHIQTTENFSKGIIANHNTQIDYQKRYDDYQSNFDKDENGVIKTHPTRTGRQEATLKKGAREPYDRNRPKGSRKGGMAYDHTISAAEIIRDPGANAHLTLEERVDFANSEFNLHEMDAALNQSKGDLPMDEWLGNPNGKGKRPEEIFDIGAGDKRELLRRDKYARKEFIRSKKMGEQRSIEEGRKSQLKEAFRLGGEALKSVIMSLIANLARDIIVKLVDWMKSKNKSMKTFIDHIKEALKTFIAKLKDRVINAGESLCETIITAIWEPLGATLKHIWTIVKQSISSIKKAIAFVKNPENANLPANMMLLEIVRILMDGIMAAGTVLLGEVIAKGLMTTGVLATPIPGIGTLADIIGMFLGGAVCGIIGAIALKLLDDKISKKQKALVMCRQIDTGNAIIKIQEQKLELSQEKLKRTKIKSANAIAKRHANADDIIMNSMKAILENN